MNKMLLALSVGCCLAQGAFGTGSLAVVDGVSSQPCINGQCTDTASKVGAFDPCDSLFDYATQYGPFVYVVQEKPVEDVVACLNAWDNPNVTALVLGMAVENERFDIVERIIASGVNVNANPVDFIWTPLHHAAFNGVKYAKALLAAGAKVNVCDNNGVTPTHCAAEGNPEVLQLFLDAGANMHAGAGIHPTPLHYAVMLDGATALLYGETYGEMSVAGMSEEDLVAAFSSLPSTIVRIVEDGVTKYKITYTLDQVLELARRSKYAYKNAANLELLLAAGANVNVCDSTNSTPLHYAVRQGNTEAVKILLAAPGIKRDAQDNKGMTPLQYAEALGEKDIVALLS